MFYGGDVVKRLSYVFVFDVKVSHFLPFDVSNAADGGVVEDF